jgi:phospholipase C
MRVLRLLTACGAAAFLIGCGVGGTLPSPGPTPTPPPARSPIKHIVIIIQENRTVDSLFNGLPGADTVTSGKDHLGHTVQLHQVELENGSDPCHDHTCWVTTHDGGKMDGFDLNNPDRTGPDFDYAFVDPAETAPYFAMAKKFTFADEFFQSNSGPSYTAHQYMVAGQSQLVDENPVLTQRFAGWGCDDPPGSWTKVLGDDGKDHVGPFPCFSYRTIVDEMDPAGVTWHYYAPIIDTNGAIWSTFDANQQVREGPDWQRNVVSPETKFLTDIVGGTLQQVTWIVPSGPDSDHAGAGGGNGPSWVTALVNAIGTSQYWNDTAIFITWDDWGGWFDHVAPKRLDDMGLGYRVPLVVISPYARLAYVSHTPHESASLMKFVEEDFGLSQLGQVDGRADDLSDCFDFSQPPTPFTTFQAPPGA